MSGQPDRRLDQAALRGYVAPAPACVGYSLSVFRPNPRFGARRMGGEPTISIVVVTLDRLHLLRQCVENVLLRTTRATEFIIWDNGSSDGTPEYLQSLADSRFRILLNGENVGLNAYARAFRHATGDYFVEVDDDVIDAPQGWDDAMLHAFRTVPRMGFLASNIVDDGKSTASEIFFRKESHRFVKRQPIQGVSLIDGPVGGYCTMTSREVYEEAGGFPEHDELFFREDGEYCAAVRRLGYDAAILADLRVLHASGPAYSIPPGAAAAKERFYARRDQRRRRRTAIKKLLERIPGVSRLNRRMGLWMPAGD